MEIGPKRGQKGVILGSFWTPFLTPFCRYGRKGHITSTRTHSIDLVLAIVAKGVKKGVQKGGHFGPILDPFLTPFLTLGRYWHIECAIGLIYGPFELTVAKRGQKGVQKGGQNGSKWVILGVYRGL